MGSIVGRAALAALIIFLGLSGTSAGDLSSTTGVRAGVGDSRNSESFTQYEAHAEFPLPWRWESAGKWVFGTFLGASAGLLTGAGEAFVGAIGPGGYMMSPSGRFVFTAETQPTYISRYDFGTQDLGGRFQFTSTFCIRVHFLGSGTAGYCARHMSNAGIYDQNPGVDTHLIEVGFRF
jgi:hypothetical protein